MSVLSDDLRALIDRCLAGDQSAMIDLVERFRSKVFGLCFRMLGQRQDAEDAAQETFVRALRHLRHWDPRRDFEPWLLAIAGNRCRTLLAARRKRPAMLPIVEDLHQDTSSDWPAARQLAEEIQAAVERLRPTHREAFLLFHHAELSYEQIAQALRKPLGTIKTWIRRARQDLVAQLQQREVIAESRP
jgi:RNA polymerase sigma-70 factor (ECF subfamily)